MARDTKTNSKCNSLGDNSRTKGIVRARYLEVCYPETLNHPIPMSLEHTLPQRRMSCHSLVELFLGLLVIIAIFLLILLIL